MTIDAIITTETVRLVIFATFIFLWVFGAVCIGWLSHLSNKTHKNIVDIDKRLRRLEEHVAHRNSGHTE